MVESPASFCRWMGTVFLLSQVVIAMSKEKLEKCVLYNVVDVDDT